MKNTINFEINQNCFKLTENVQSFLLCGIKHAKKDVFLSVVIPTYKRYDLFCDALRSVRDQAEVDFPWEIIIMDNEAYDGKSNAVERYIRRLNDSRIVYYRNEEHLRPGDNFNRGILLASGKWVTMLHDDDLLMPATLKNIGKAIQFLSKQRAKPLAAICAQYYQFSNNQNLKQKNELIKTVRQYWGSQPTDYYFERLTHRNPIFETHIGASIPSNGTTYLREAVLEVGGFNDDLGISADLILCYCLERKWSVYRSGVPYGMYRWGGNTMIKRESAYQTVQNGYEFREFLYSKNIFMRIYGKCVRKVQHLDYINRIVGQNNAVSQTVLSVEDFSDICSVHPNPFANVIYFRIIKPSYRHLKNVNTKLREARSKNKTERVYCSLRSVKNRFKKGVRRIFPSSYHNMSLMFSKLNNQLSQLQNSVNWANERMEKMSKKIDKLQQKNENLFWCIQARDGETRQAAQERVFFGMRRPTSGKLFYIQTIMLDILRFYHNFCQKNDLQYWLWGGTLLGAIRHHGFIPWDDDMDIGMMRKDFEKFKELLAKENTPYVLMDYYECGVAPYRCGRFAKLKYADSDILCFVDIFVFDYDNAETRKESKEEYYFRRKELQKRIWDYCTSNDLAVENSPIKDIKKKAELDRIFDEFICENTISVGNNLQWSLELFLAPEIWLWPLEDFFPLQTLDFEGIKVMAPRNAMSVVEKMYSDIYHIPDDMYANYHDSVFNFTGGKNLEIGKINK